MLSFSSIWNFLIVRLLNIYVILHCKIQCYSPILQIKQHFNNILLGNNISLILYCKIHSYFHTETILWIKNLLYFWTGYADYDNGTTPLEVALNDPKRVKYHSEHLSYLLEAMRYGCEIFIFFNVNWDVEFGFMILFWMF